MKKNELIARLVNRTRTSGAPRNFFCYGATVNRNFFCYGATANRNYCYAAVDQRPVQAAPAK